MTEEQIQKLVEEVGTSFTTFGGGRLRDESNPIAIALRDGPYKFVLGTDVEAVVRFVLARVVELAK